MFRVRLFFCSMLWAMRCPCLLFLLVGVLLLAAPACTVTEPPPAPGSAIDRDLLDVTLPQLQRFYTDKKYTVTQVVRWHLDRVDRYSGVNGPIETDLREDALAAAARE